MSMRDLGKYLSLSDYTDLEKDYTDLSSSLNVFVIRVIAS